MPLEAFLRLLRQGDAAMWSLTEFALFIGCGVVLATCVALVSAAKNHDTQRRG